MISFFEKSKASISIFLILILFPMYTCLYLVIDTARYSAAKSKVSGAMDLTGNAALADYDKTFKELYGLFVMSGSNEELENNLVSYFSNMIDSTDLSLGDTTLTRKIISSAVGSTFENTVKTETKDFQATYKTNSAIYNPVILQSHMRNHMKYKAPLSFVNGLSKKLSSFYDLGSLAKIKDSIDTEDGVSTGAGLSNNTGVAKAEATKSADKVGAELSSGADAKTQVEALKEIANTDTKSVVSNVENVDIPSLVSANILKVISLETVDSEIGIEDLSALSSATQNAYEMEYITTYFSCLTNQVSKGPAKFGEVEYIVFGKDNLTTNILLTIDLIFALRVIFNTVYVYTNSNMRQSALVLATSISGWTGVGIPIVQNAILIALAMAESVLDVSSLCKGETIPIYKNSSTWTLGINGITKTLAKGVENYASKAIDDVFYKIENASLERLDEIENTALDYMEQTGLGAVESLTSEVVTKVEQKITSLTQGVKTDYTKEELNAELLEAVNSVGGNSPGISSAKKLFIEKCLPTLVDKLYENFGNVFSEDETIASAAGTAITNAIDKAYLSLFNELETEVLGFMENEEEKLATVLSKASDKVKGETIEIIEDYEEKLSKYLGSADTTSVSISSGVGMSYLDYLKLFVLIGLNSNTRKSNMLKRCAVIMQINCQKKDATFNITRCYTSLNINTVTSVSNHQIKTAKTYEY